MKPATGLALLLAGLGGLGAAVWAKNSGFFARKTVEEPPRPQLLAATRNLFVADALDNDSVGLRPATMAEMKEMQADPAVFLPPIPGSVFMRTPALTIEAGQPLRRKDFTEPKKPDGLNSRLVPGSRAVAVQVSKPRAAGGLIVAGDWVDVLLTTKFDGADGSTGVRQALLARKVRVIAKRDTLVQSLAAQPDDQPVKYTLELNPYRAALLDYVSGKGALALAVLPKPDAAALEALRQQALEGKANFHWSDPASKEFADEEQRVAAFTRGEAGVGEADLIRLMSLDPPSYPLAVEVLAGGSARSSARFVGNQKSGYRKLEDDQKGFGPMGDGKADSAPAGGYSFSAPDAAGGGGKGKTLATDYEARRADSMAKVAKAKANAASQTPAGKTPPKKPAGQAGGGAKAAT